MQTEWSLHKSGSHWFISHDLCSLGTPAINYPGNNDFRCSYCLDIIPTGMVVQWRLLLNEK